MTGTSLALLMQIWMLGYDWPMIIGGKNFASLPPFIPVTFELTVFFCTWYGWNIHDRKRYETVQVATSI